MVFSCDAVFWLIEESYPWTVACKPASPVHPKCSVSEKLLQNRTKQRRHSIVNYTFIVPCPANERFPFHPSYMPFANNQTPADSQGHAAAATATSDAVKSQSSRARGCLTVSELE